MGMTCGISRAAGLLSAVSAASEAVNPRPFYHFQSDDLSEEEWMKLVLQLARRLPYLEPDVDVVKAKSRGLEPPFPPLPLTSR